MATIQNERDKLLQAAPVRFIPPPLPQEIVDAVDATKGLRIVSTGSQIKIIGGTPTPSSITFGVEFKLISGTVSWSVVSGTATLSIIGNTATLTNANMSTDRVRIRASLTVAGVTYTDEADVTRVVDGAKGDAGTNGDAVDIIFRRNPTQPVTPGSSSGAPYGWYSDVSSVPASNAPMWASVGFKAGSSSTYTWQTPVRLDGTAIVELTIYRRATTTPATPSGGSFNFSTQTLTPPADWSWQIPAGTNPVWASKAVVTAYGTTGSVSVSGWTKPVESFRNGTNGSPGTNGVRGTVSISQSTSGSTWNSTTANNAITSFTGSSTRVTGDQVTLYNTSAGWAETRYWTGSAWQFLEQVIDGNLIVTGTLSANKITAGTLTGITIRTAATGNRIEMASNKVTFYHPTGRTELAPLIGDWGGLDITTYSSNYGVRIRHDVSNSSALHIGPTNTSQQGILLSLGAGNGRIPIVLGNSGSSAPTLKPVGAIAFFDGALHFCNGAAWHRVMSTIV